MCQLAVKNITSVEVSNIERLLAKRDNLKYVPTYKVLEEFKQNGVITIITTAETYNQIKDWESGQWILNIFRFLILPFKSSIHSSDIRKMISEKQNWYHSVPPEVCNYIHETKLYE